MTCLPVALLLLAAEGGHDNLMLWRIVNFVILAGLLGWLIRKNAGPFFAARGEAIAKSLAESRRLSAESEARAKAIEERMSRLGQEIEELKAKAKAEMAAEHARLERETAAAVQKVFAFAEQEIAATAKAARAELRAYTAQLAVELAEKKIAARMTPESHRNAMAAFVRNL
jgi:F-type H+-transporting ATPase subunit b